MSDNANVRLYEGMFLLQQEAAGSDFAGCVEFVRNVFERAGAEVLVLRKWDECRLAYDIRGQRRGVFLMAYFKVNGAQIANIDRDCELSEIVLRSMVIRADHVGETELNLAADGAELSLQMAPTPDDNDDRRGREYAAPAAAAADGAADEAPAADAPAAQEAPAEDAPAQDPPAEEAKDASKAETTT